MGRKLEADFQADLKKEIENTIVGSIVLKTNEQFKSGFPDLIILYKEKYAVLECKRSAREQYRPNQEYYLDAVGQFAYSATIYPENKEVILDELQRSLTS